MVNQEACNSLSEQDPVTVLPVFFDAEATPTLSNVDGGHEVTLGDRKVFVAAGQVAIFRFPGGAYSYFGPGMDNARAEQMLREANS